MHTQGEAIKFIEGCFGPAKLTNGGLNANVLCPVCHEKTGTDKKKLAIHTVSWLTRCWVCGFKGRTPYALLRRYKPQEAVRFLETMEGTPLLVGDQDNAFLLEQQAIRLPVGFQLLAPLYHDEEAPFYIRQAKQYLVNRGLTEREFWYFKLGVTSVDPGYKNRIIIPSHDADGELNFFTSRAHRPGTRPKYFNPTLHRDKVVFNELNIDWTERLTIVEGPFDLFKVNDNATCLLGKQLTKECRLFQQIIRHQTPVLVCLDSDAKKECLNTAKLLSGYNIDVQVMELPEGIKDPGDVSRDMFVQELTANCVVDYSELYYLRRLIE